MNKIATSKSNPAMQVKAAMQKAQNDEAMAAKAALAAAIAAEEAQAEAKKAEAKKAEAALVLKAQAEAEKLNPLFIQLQAVENIKSAYTQIVEQATPEVREQLATYVAAHQFNPLAVVTELNNRYRDLEIAIKAAYRSAGLDTAIKIAGMLSYPLDVLALCSQQDQQELRRIAAYKTVGKRAKNKGAVKQFFVTTPDGKIGKGRTPMEVCRIISRNKGLDVTGNWTANLRALTTLNPDALNIGESECWNGFVVTRHADILSNTE